MVNYFFFKDNFRGPDGQLLSGEALKLEVNRQKQVFKVFQI